MSEFRLQRVQNLLREQVSDMIMRGVIKDPRVNSMLSITEVKVSKDLSYADLYISSLESRKKLEKSVIALNHAAGFIQHKLKKVLRLRTTPVLRFRADASIAHGYDISRRIDELVVTPEPVPDSADESTDAGVPENESDS